MSTSKILTTDRLSESDDSSQRSLVRIRQRFGHTAIRLIVAAFLIVGLTRTSAAGLITSPAGIPSPSVIDFSQFVGMGYNFTFGPTQIGGLVAHDVVFTAAPAGGGNSGLGAVLGDGGYGLASNGNWSTGPGGNAYTGLDADSGSMTYTINDGLVSGVGGFINYVPDAGFGPTLIEALAADGITVLESYVLNTDAPISTPGGIDDGEFRGILRATADIGGFRVSGGYVVLDNFTFGGQAAVQPVPEPSSLALCTVLGIAGAVARFKRRRAERRLESV